MKKLLSMLLVLTMFASMFASTAFATYDSLPQAEQGMADTYEGGYVYVTDDEGKVQSIWVEERTYYANSGLGQATRSASPEVGDKKTITVKIKNSQLEAGPVIGAALSHAATTKLGSLVADAVIAKMGTAFIGGVSLSVAIVAAIGAVNDLVFGNDGFEVTVVFRWAHFVNHKEGIDEYDWSFDGLSVKAY